MLCGQTGKTPITIRRTITSKILLSDISVFLFEKKINWKLFQCSFSIALLGQRMWIHSFQSTLLIDLNNTQHNHNDRNNQENVAKIVYYLPFVSVVVVEVDSWDLVGCSGEAGVVMLLLVVVEVDSFSLLQPANSAKVTKPAAIIAIFFMVVS
jgi:hypothetical protein